MPIDQNNQLTPPVWHEHSPERTLFSAAFPSNPIPFAQRIADLCRLSGSNAIRSDEARANLLVLLQMAYGQASTVDSVAEYDRLQRHYDRS